MSTLEQILQVSDFEIFVKLDWLDPNPPFRAVILINHGWGEHSDCYQEFVNQITQKRLANVVRWDMPGHGRSSGIRGWFASWDGLLEITDKVIAGIKKTLPFSSEGYRWIFWGHSMGGLLTLKGIQDGIFHPDGVILSNPFTGLRFQPPVWKQKLADWLYHIPVPLTVPTGIRPEDLSDVPASVDKIKKDPWRHQVISAPVFKGALQAQKQLLHNPLSIGIPLLWLTSAQDPISDPESQKRVFDRMKNPEKTWFSFDSQAHELIQSQIRDQVFQEIENWWQKRLVPFWEGLD